jgi:hypothetical protein
MAGIRPAGLRHSAWELLEHMRISLEDIIRFSGVMEPPRTSGSGDLPAGYTPLNWPGDYWPASPAPGNADQWNESVAAIEAGVAAFTGMLEDQQRDLFKPFPWGEGQTLLREALLIADHNAYHLGQLVLVRRMIERS